MLRHDLTLDLMMEILVRLPVKSLLRFKSISKFWYALITDPSFIEKHLEWSDSIPDFLSKKSLLVYRIPMENRVPYISLTSKDQPHCVPHDTEPFRNKEYIWFYGQCDGIFCFYVINQDRDEDLILWNPTTKEHKVIPPSLQREDRTDENVVFDYGFGFDPITKDYKIVEVYSKRSLQGAGAIEQRQVQVYNLSTNSWRIIDVVVPNYGYCHVICRPYLNGACHWLGHGDYEEYQREKFILSFDFSKEAFRTIQLSSRIDDDSVCAHNVFVMDKDLAVVNRDLRYGRFEIWVMNEYGVESSSWSKKFEIGFGPPLNPVSILGSCGKNEILLQKYKGPFISYNLQNQHTHIFQIPIPKSMLTVTCVFDYVESLVPLQRKYNKI